MRLGEGPRWALALLGLPLWFSSSLVPALSGPAEYAYRCPGASDPVSSGCAPDGLPALEMAALLAALLFAYPFARFAFSLYAPAPPARRLKWRLATRSDPADLWPTLHIFGFLGAAWCAWCLWTYPPAREFLPFQIFWGLFTFWFIGGTLAALADPLPD